MCAQGAEQGAATETNTDTRKAILDYLNGRIESLEERTTLYWDYPERVANYKAKIAELILMREALAEVCA